MTVTVIQVKFTSIYTIDNYFQNISNPAREEFQWFFSQLIRYSRACGSYHDFLDRGLLLTRGY